MNAATPPHSAPAAASRTSRHAWLGQWLPWRDWLARHQRSIFRLAIAVAVGLILGQQLVHHNQRLIKAAVGLVVLYAAWRFPIPVSLSAFLVLFPFPFPTVYGTSNTIVIFLVTAVWLARIVLRTAPPAGRTALDLPIVLLMGAYLVSFINIENATALGQGLVAFSVIVACILMYYLIVNTVRDEATLRRMVRIITVTASLCWAVGAYELMFPGQPLIRGWILAPLAHDQTRAVRGWRVGGPFGDFELFSEYCAMLLPLMLFQFLQARGMRSRTLWATLVVADFFTLMATITRGGIVSLTLAMIYLLYRLRRTLTLSQFMLALSLAVCLAWGVEFYLANFTVSGSVFDRLLGTKLVGGLPDTRSFWPEIIARIKEHPWVGHGPYYEFGQYGREKLNRYLWPHNGYLYYLHTVGIFGTAAFLWILAKLWFATSRHSVPRLAGPDYARSILLVWHIMLTVFIIDETKIEYLRNASYQFWPWIVFALTVATLNIVRRRETAGIPEAAAAAGAVRRGPAPSPAGSPVT